jgi:hypothetical protein
LRLSRLAIVELNYFYHKSKFYAYFIDPPVLGSHHAVPVLFGMGIMPTRGQALFIFYIWGINIILCAANYKVTWPNLWFTNLTEEMTDYIAVRTGMVSFGNLILALLFARFVSTNLCHIPSIGRVHRADY